MFRRWSLLIGIVAAFFIGLFISLHSTLALAHDHEDDDDERSCNWGEWENISSCVATKCGTSDGKINQIRSCTERECDYSCPTIHFEWEVEGNCPTSNSAYTSYDSHKECKKKINNTWKYADKETIKKSANVVYEKSNDPNKCHRPSDNKLSSTYGMDSGARNEFKEHNSEWKNAVEVNCHNKTVDTDRRSTWCHNAEVQACSSPSPRPSCSPSPSPSTSPTPTPTPETSPTPTPTNTPDPGTGRTSGSYIDPVCKGDIHVRMNINEDGHGVEAVTATFKYQNETKTAKTNGDGEAYVSFAYRGEDKVFMSADGWPGQDALAKASTDCDPGEGQVLGATTMAATGVFEDSLMNILGLSGSLLTLLGVKRYGKKN